MPFGQVIGNMTLYLILGLLLPGVVIIPAAIGIFPTVFTSHLTFSGSGGLSVGVVTGTIVLASFLQPSFPWFMERTIFDSVWKRLFISWRQTDWQLWSQAYYIVGLANGLGINYHQYHQTFGLFLLFYNTTFWLAAMSLVKLILLINPAKRDMDSSLALAIIILFASSFHLLWVSPNYKLHALHALQSLKDVVDQEYRMRYRSAPPAR